MGKGVKRAKGGSLLDAIGHGLLSANEESKVPQPREKAPSSLGRHSSGTGDFGLSWQKNRELLDRYAQRKDIEAFERVLAQELGIKRNEKLLEEWRKQKRQWSELHSQARSTKVNGAAQSNGINGGSSTKTNMLTKTQEFPTEKPVPAWNWPRHNDGTIKSADLKSTHRRKVFYILAKIFQCCPVNDEKQATDSKQNNGTDWTLSIAFAP